MLPSLTLKQGLHQTDSDVASAVALRWDAEFRFKLRLYLPISKSSPLTGYLRFTKLMQDLGKKKINKIKLNLSRLHRCTKGNKRGWKEYHRPGLYTAIQRGCYLEQFVPFMQLRPDYFSLGCWCFRDTGLEIKLGDCSQSWRPYLLKVCAPITGAFIHFYKKYFCSFFTQ